MMQLDAIIQALGLPDLPERWNALSAAAEARAEREGLFSDAWLCALEARFGLFPWYFGDIRRGAAAVREHGALRDYALLLSEAQRDRGVIRGELANLSTPAAPAGADTLAYDFAILMAMLPLIPEAYERYAARGVTEDSIAGSFRTFEENLIVFDERNGRPGYDIPRLRWSQYILDAQVTRFGRLEFEARPALGGNTAVFRRSDGALRLLAVGGRFHRDGMVLGSIGFEDDAGAYDADYAETDEYAEGYPIDPALGRACRERVRLDKSEWTQTLCPRDPVFSVHIPIGPSLTQEACDASYAQARELMPKYYPELHARAWACLSWLMDPQLAGLLRPDSNILRFQRPYLLCPVLSSGRGVFMFVYTRPYARLEDLPERTTLERALKRHYLDGKYIYEHVGIFF